jgi:glucose 1-dehydrogenase
LGREGANVCVNYYSGEEEDAAREIVRDIEQSGGVSAIAVQAGVGSEDDVRRMVRETVGAFGGVDVLVNNAGIEKQVPLLETSMNEWESTLRTNLTGPFLCIREVGRQMVDAGAVSW